MSDLLDLNFRTIDGRNFSLQLPEELEVSSLIELVAEALQQQQPAAAAAAEAAAPAAAAEAATAANLRLIFRGQALQPQQQLQHYRIQSGQTIHVVQRPGRPQQQEQQEQQQQEQQQQQQQQQRQWAQFPIHGGGAFVVAPGAFTAVSPRQF